MGDILFVVALVAHILAVMVAVGTVTVTDYLHILGLRNARLEKESLFVFPSLSHLIRFCLFVIYITGILLVIGKPELLQSSLFLLKMFLVVLVTINGYILHHTILPRVRESIRKKTHDLGLLKQSAFSGSLSLVSWYAIVILALTKTLGYTWFVFLGAYIAGLIIAYVIALYIETRSRHHVHS